MTARFVSGTAIATFAFLMALGSTPGTFTANAAAVNAEEAGGAPMMHHQGMEHGRGTVAETDHHPGMDHAAHHASMHGGEGVVRGSVPTEPGQDAFGTIQEIIAILEADPATDWSKVDIEALRTHLVDMNKVTVDAQVAAAEVPGGAQFVARGEERTLEALRRMVPAHAQFIDGMNGWKVVAKPREYGVTLTVTSDDPAQTARIRALGFIGVMATGAHHQAHHLAIARGGDPHAGHAHGH